jgi:hypothetical protein
MNPSQVLGMALKDCHAGDNSVTITVHSPDFEPDIQDVSYYFRSQGEMPLLEREAMDICFGTVLDAGAAVGSHSLELQKRGIDVTALELSSDACEIMKQRGVRKILNQDIFGTVNKKFDTVLMLMNGIGLVGTTGGLVRFLDHAKTFVDIGGQIVFDSSSLVYLFGEIADNDGHLEGNDRYFGEIEFVIEYRGVRSDCFSWLYIDFDTACRIANASGIRTELIAQDEDFRYLARFLF